MRSKKCLVSFSGGQDSSTLAALCKEKFEETKLIFFRYGQKHSVEEESAFEVSKSLGLDMMVIDVSFFSNISTSSLLRNQDIQIGEKHPNNKNLPSTFVPNRNGFFILLLHSIAQSLNYDVIALGVSEADYSGYPDCRRSFIKNFISSLNEGSERNIGFYTPFSFMSKKEEFLLAQELNVLDLIREKTHTCYKGERKVLNDYGYGCGECDACRLRKEGWKEFQKERFSFPSISKTLSLIDKEDKLLERRNNEIIK